MSEEMQEKEYPLQHKAAFAGTTLVTMGLLDLLAHLGPTGLFVGGLASYVAWKHGPELFEQFRGALPSPEPHQEQDEEKPTQMPATQQTSGKRSLLDRALGLYPEPIAEDPEPEEKAKDAKHDQLERNKQEATTVKRLSIEEIVRHTPANSYKLYIGRSLTRPGHPAIMVNFYKQHFKFIGASQHGKSSMVAAFLSIVIQTHDTEHVLVVLLDLEDRTSNLFNNIDHLAEFRVGEQWVPLHARTHEQVLEYLGYVLEIVRSRYDLSIPELLSQPVILVYLEEFIELKDYFKTRIETVPDHEKAQAKRDYADLVYRIKKIARLGLKVRVQLLMCAQVDYRDEDLQEALINVTAGMSFCVRVSAAQAAGFYQSELLARNAREDKVGQAVVEMAGCKDLVLAPDFNLEQKLQALEEAEQRQASVFPRLKSQTLRSASERKQESPSPFASEGQRRQEEVIQEWKQKSAPKPERPRVKTEIERFVEVYEANPAGSYADWGREMGCGKDKAGNLFKEAKERGLLVAASEKPDHA